MISELHAWQQRQSLWVRAGVYILAGLAFGIAGNLLTDPVRAAWAGSSNLILRLATLGFQSQVDGLYRRMARGYLEAASLDTNFLVHIWWLLFLSTMLIWGMGVFSDQEVEGRERSSGVMPRSVRRVRRWLIVGYSLALLSGAMGIFGAVKLIVVSNGVARYRQVRMAVVPYTDEVTLQKLDSRFALMQTESEYVEILAELTTIAKNHGIDVRHIGR